MLARSFLTVLGDQFARAVVADDGQDDMICDVRHRGQPLYRGRLVRMFAEIDFVLEKRLS